MATAVAQSSLSKMNTQNNGGTMWKILRVLKESVTIYMALLTSIALATSVFSRRHMGLLQIRVEWLYSTVTQLHILPPGADTTIPDAYIINVSEVAKSISRVKIDKAVGPDDIPNWILHDYATILAPPVCVIFNSSLREGAVPMLWKYADIRPIPNIRPPTLIHRDLRPICLTPVLSKCLEKFICDWITVITIDPKQ